MSSAPQFINTPRAQIVTVSTANLNLDGSGTITSLITGASTGTRVLEIVAQCAATSAAALVNIFLSTDGGSTWKLIDQISISAATSSATVKANKNSTGYSNLILPNTSCVLGVTTTISQATNVYALGGDF
jgi:hypothetical protein